MLRQRLSEKYAAFQSTPLSSYGHNLKNEKGEKPFLSEYKWGIVGLVVSFLVITAKLFAAYRKWFLV